MRKQTCCFTGHRDIPQDKETEITERTEKIIKELIGKGVKYFGVGGALGFDTLVAKILFRLRETEHPSIKVILVYPFEGYINRWTQEQQAVYRQLLPCYNKRVCIADHPSKEAYLQRNRHLANNSGYCISYCTRDSGGTAYTVKYAHSKGLTILNTADFDMEALLG